MESIGEHESRRISEFGSVFAEIFVENWFGADLRNAKSSFFALLTPKIESDMRRRGISYLCNLYIYDNNIEFLKLRYALVFTLRKRHVYGLFDDARTRK